MLELAFNNIKKYLNTHLVFEDLTFRIYDNEKVGIVGSNGCGKTTILKMIAGIEEMTRHDEGTMAIPKGKSIGYLQQRHDYDEEASVKDVLTEAFQELKDIEKELVDLEGQMKSAENDALDKLLNRYSYLQNAYEAGGGYDQEEKLSRVCKGLKLSDEFLSKKFDVLSGGEKTTVVLGKILLETPDILMLDEPTNHLDMESAEWLEGYIKNYRGMVIIVSHDRYFLDNTVSKIIEIEYKEGKTYKGNYSQFVKQKEEDLMKQFHDYKEQQKKIKAMKEQIKRLRDWAIRADNIKFFKRAESIQKKLDKMEKINKPKMEKDSMNLNLTESKRSGNEVILAEGLCKSFQDKTLLIDADLLVKFKERVALVGANGCGKTTFLKMLLGNDEDFNGKLKLGANINYAYLPQNIHFEDEEITAIDFFREDIEIAEGKARGYLAKFFFFAGEPFKKIKFLSGGERVRLKMARLLYDKVNLLILDEPTNHLDIESIEAVEDALENFGGTIFFISHDRYFINKMSNKVVEIEEKKFNVYDGNYEFYREAKEKKIAAEKLKLEAQEVEKKKEKKKRVRVMTQKDIEKKQQKIEAKIEAVELEIKNIDKLIEDNALDYVKLQELTAQREEKEECVEELMLQWDSIE